MIRRKESSAAKMPRRNEAEMDAQEHGKKRWRDRVNGRPLATLEWGTSVLNVPPSLHRFKSALGLTVGLYLGAELMKVMTGNGMRGENISKEMVHPMLQPLHGKLSYNFFSDAPADRWMRVFQNAVPGILGGIGTLSGSKHYFYKRERESRDHTYLDEYEKRAEMIQAKPWGKASAFSSMFSCVSGFSWLPVPNYGLSLGSRFTLASGRKVALPGAGRFWSNNRSIFPFGPPELLDKMIEYAVGNPTRDPKQLEAMAQGVLAAWFKDLQPEQVEAFAQEVKTIRDQFLREGGVPEELKSELENELRSHFKGAGLEETLEKIGLDPLEAIIGNNGFSAKFAEKTGAGKRMKELRNSYVEEYQARKAQAGVEQTDLQR